MASLEQKIAAEVLRERGRKLLKVKEGEKTKKELEAERLFFWILNRLECKVEESDTPQRDYRLIIEEKFRCEENGKITFFDGSKAEYHSKYVYGSDINDVLIRVKCSLNSINGYSVCFTQPHNNQQKAIMVVELSV